MATMEAVNRVTSAIVSLSAIYLFADRRQSDSGIARLAKPGNRDREPFMRSENKRAHREKSGEWGVGSEYDRFSIKSHPLGKN